jgi:hypothetical protein
MDINEKWFNDDLKTYNLVLKWLNVIKGTKNHQEFNKKLKDNSKNNTEFYNIVSELAVFNLLTKSGFNVEYSPKIYLNSKDYQTPDYRITTPDGITFIAEVASINETKDINGFNQLYEQLKAKIESENLGFDIEIKFYFHLEYEKASGIDIDNLVIKKIHEFFSNWNGKDFLLNEDLFTLKIIKPNCIGHLNITSAGWSLGYYSKIDRLKDSFVSKNNKYDKLLDVNNYPYVIILFNNFSSQIEWSDFQKFFVGEKIYFFGAVLDKEPVLYDERDALTNIYDLSHLNGVLIVEHLQWWHVGYFNMNDKALFKLPDDFIDKIEKFNGVPEEKIEEFLIGDYIIPSIDDFFNKAKI